MITSLCSERFYFVGQEANPFRMRFQQVCERWPFPGGNVSPSQSAQIFADFDRWRFAPVSNEFGFEPLEKFENRSTVLVHDH
jgi:hypothetical protein